MTEEERLIEEAAEGADPIAAIARALGVPYGMDITTSWNPDLRAVRVDIGDAIVVLGSDEARELGKRILEASAKAEGEEVAGRVRVDICRRHEAIKLDLGIAIDKLEIGADNAVELAQGILDGVAKLKGHDPDGIRADIEKGEGQVEELREAAAEMVKLFEAMDAETPFKGADYAKYMRLRDAVDAGEEEAGR